MDCQKGGVYIDATGGGGGYAEEILKKIGPKGFLLCLDRDERAVEAIRTRLENIWQKVFRRPGGRKPSPSAARNFLVAQENFRDLAQVAMQAGIKKADGVVFDLGVSSPQIDQAERGFSFEKEGPLDMRMDRSQALSAQDLISRAEPEELAGIIRDLGEEKFAGPIARALVKARAIRPIKTTGELVAVVRKVLLQRGLQLHNKTLARIFQALRIAVNDELENLKAGLAAAAGLLKPGGRLVLVSFHSLEDRIVKEYMKRESTGCLCPAVVPVCRCGHVAALKILTRKPVEAGEQEIGNNPRARSAKLRAAEKII